MSKISDKGFVMASFPYRDRDRMLHILTRDHGLISAGARGACSVKSKLRPLSNLFSLCNYEFFYHKERFYVDDGEVIEAFLGISESIEHLTAASFASEVFRDLTRNSPPDQKYFDLWAYTLYEISQSERPVLLSRLSTLRLLAEAGYAPQLERCGSCQRPISSDATFSFQTSGLVCGSRACESASGDSIRLSEGTLALLRHVLTAPFNRLYRFTVTADVEKNASQFLDLYLCEKMEKDYKMLDLLEHPFDMDLSGLKRNCD
ncbi:MAG: DNA repair protein RecO [Eubacteriales bacterium]|nr:DNA repair protein RecO [Eubacteriales bacterium]MDD4323953.1 DNA repair protein RecO [Eubacteriales bacterium]MDD4540899.1 DNA repair protein RecO [Eubacteriales bacterium]